MPQTVEKSEQIKDPKQIAALYKACCSLAEIINNETSYNTQLKVLLENPKIKEFLLANPSAEPMMEAMQTALAVSDKILAFMKAIEFKVNQKVPGLLGHSGILSKYKEIESTISKTKMQFNSAISIALDKAIDDIKKTNVPSSENAEKLQKLQQTPKNLQYITIDDLKEREELINLYTTGPEKTEALKQIELMRGFLTEQDELKPQIAQCMYQVIDILPTVMQPLQDGMEEYFKQTTPALQMYRIISTNHPEQLAAWQDWCNINMKNVPQISNISQGSNVPQLLSIMSAPAQRPLRVGMPIEELYKHLDSAGVLGVYATTNQTLVAIQTTFKKLALGLNEELMGDDICLFNGKKEYKITEFYSADPGSIYKAIQQLKPKIDEINNKIQTLEEEIKGIEPSQALAQIEERKNKISRLQVQLTKLRAVQENKPEQFRQELTRLQALKLEPKTIEQKIDVFLVTLKTFRELQIILENTPKTSVDTIKKVSAELAIVSHTVNNALANLSADEKKLIEIYGKLGVGDLFIIDSLVKNGLQSMPDALKLHISEAASTINTKSDPGFEIKIQTIKHNKLSQKQQIVYDEHHRAVAKIQYRTDKNGDHMDIVCGKKEIQQFADDNIQYKAKNIIETIKALSARTGVDSDAHALPNNEIDSNFKNTIESLLTTEFPGCTFTITARESSKDSKVKIKIKDKHGTEILHIKEDEGKQYKIVTAKDPHQQFFNADELHKRALQAATIAVNLTQSEADKQLCMCEIRSADPNHTKDISQYLINTGVKNIKTNQYPNAYNDRTIILKVKSSELNKKRYQEILSAGYIPTFANDEPPKEMPTQLSIESCKEPFKITTTDPLLAIEQYKTMMEHNVQIELNPEMKLAIVKQINMNASSPNIIIKNSATGENNRDKLQTAIALGFIPVLETDFLENIHNPNLKDNPIIITTTSPKIAASQWKALITNGIPTKFADEHIRKAALQEIGKVELSITVDAPASKQDVPDRDAVAKNILAADAIATYQATLNEEFSSSFADMTKSLILEAQYDNIHTVNVPKPSLEIFKRTLENGLLFNDESLQRLIANSKKLQSDVKIMFSGITDAKSTPLLLKQIKQIEEINAKTGNKIKYNMDPSTAKAIKPAWDDIIKGSLRYFYKTYYNSLLSKYKTTTTGSNWFSKRISEWLKVRRTKSKQTEDDVNISEERFSQIANLHTMLDSIINSTDSISSSERIFSMMEKLNTLITDIQKENNLFDSRLLKICIQMKHELEVIKEMNDVVYPQISAGPSRNSVTQELKSLQRNSPQNHQDVTSQQKLMTPQKELNSTNSSYLKQEQPQKEHESQQSNINPHKNPNSPTT